MSSLRRGRHHPGHDERVTGMTMTSEDVELRVRRERDRLLTVLEDLDADGWRTPSLCAGWTVRDLVVHLLMPYELSVPRFLALMVRSGLRFDRAADRWARRDPRSPAQVDRKSTRLNSSHANISYAVFCLKKKNKLPSSHYLVYLFLFYIKLRA